jgi:hypothetical protein
MLCTIIGEPCPFGMGPVRPSVKRDSDLCGARRGTGWPLVRNFTRAEDQYLVDKIAPAAI